VFKLVRVKSESPSDTQLQTIARRAKYTVAQRSFENRDIMVIELY